MKRFFDGNQSQWKIKSFYKQHPVTLQVLEQLSSSLIDVHTQYETQNIVEAYIFQVLDALAQNTEIRQHYTAELASYKSITKGRINC